MRNLTDIGIKNALAQNIEGLIKKDKLPHAILIRGGSEELKGRLSSFLSYALVCESEDKPCGSCANCMKAQKGKHPDVITLDPIADGEKTFKISLIRELKDDAYIIPNEARSKVYILKSADKMNIQAQNALLKLIEEPPQYARFILECESSAAMLSTVMSRVTLFDIGDAIQTLSDNTEQRADETAARLMQALLQPTELDFMKITAEFEKDKELFEPVLSALQLIIRDAIVIKAGSEVTLAGHTDISRTAAAKLTINSLVKAAEEINSIKKSIARNANKNLLITRFSACMRGAAYNR